MPLFNARQTTALCHPEEIERTTVLVIGGLESAESVRCAEAALRAIVGVESASVNMADPSFDHSS